MKVEGQISFTCEFDAMPNKGTCDVMGNKFNKWLVVCVGLV